MTVGIDAHKRLAKDNIMTAVKIRRGQKRNHPTFDSVSKDEFKRSAGIFTLPHPPQLKRGLAVDTVRIAIKLSRADPA